MASTVKFDTWQNTAGELIADTAAGARLPLSGNAIINGDFGVWQRGTSFTVGGYTADRWFLGLSGATATVSQQSFTPGDIEAIGYGDAEFFGRLDVSTGNDNAGFYYRIEDVHKFAGQKVTLSFWAKGTNPGGGTVEIGISQYFGSGGSSTVASFTDTIVLTGSWQRFTITGDVNSVVGKTIGAGSYIQPFFKQGGSDTSTDAWTLDLWGVQLEAGSVATPFRPAGGGSKAAELALCQRYCQVYNESTGGVLAPGFASLTYRAPVAFRFPEMRVAPSGAISASSDFEYIHRATATTCSSGPGFNETTTTSARLQADVASGLTQGDGVILRFVSGSGGTLTLDAEL